MKKPEESKRDLETALQLNPRFRPAILNRGVAAWLRGEPDAALADFTVCLEPPDTQRLIEGAYYRGQVYLLRGDLRSAEKDFNQVIAQRPRWREVYLLRAQAHLQNNDSDGCMKDLSSYLDYSGPKLSSAEMHEMQGRLLRRAIIPKMPSQSREDVESRVRAAELAANKLIAAISEGRHSAEIYADLADLLEGLGKAADAVLVYAKAIEAAPRDPRWRIARGWTYANRGDHAHAKADFSEAVRLDSTDAEAHAGLGYALAALKTAEDAKREAAHALVDDFGGREYDYLTLHRVACIYAQLSTIAGEPAVAHQDLAIKLLRQAIAIWKRGDTGPDEVELIKQDIARRVFPPAMMQRPDFRDLLGGSLTVAD